MNCSPWFTDLTFQVPMQFCSLHHQTLLPSPVTSTTGCCFCFGSISSFFLSNPLQYSCLENPRDGGAWWSAVYGVAQSQTQLKWLSSSSSSFTLSGVISPLISSSILGTYWSGEFIFQCPIFLPFHTVHGHLKARMLKWFAIPFSSRPHFVRTLHRDPSILVGPMCHGSQFH